MTRRQSNNQCSGGIAAHVVTNIPRPKIRWKSSRLVLSGSRRLPLHLISSKRSNNQHRMLLICAGAVEGNFEGKTPQEVHQGGLVLVRQCPVSQGTCNPEQTGLPGLHMFDHPPYSLDMAPSVYHLFPELKKNENSPFFVRRGGHCCRGDLVGRKTF